MIEHDGELRELRSRCKALSAALSKVYDWMLREYAEDDPRTGEVVDKSVLPLFTDICKALSAPGLDTASPATSESPPAKTPS